MWICLGVAIRIVLEHANDKFRLCSALENDYQVEIKDISLLVDRIQLKDSLYLQINSRLTQEPAIYEFRRM